ncbi:MAG TPA: type 1 glutamine amidotransferase [Gammaproteobacteria bacterium]|nr:type 1 glutamine amidotransferase [Gammaproteobacteria bacterium]
MQTLAILVADYNLPQLKEQEDTLSYLFETFFKHSGFALKFFQVHKNQWPDFAQYSAYVITGSKESVLKPTPWIDKLEHFIQQGHYEKLIGICFGHQLITKALGGSVEKGEWHIGVHPIHYTKSIVKHGFQSPLSVRFNHQDHVKKLPPKAELLYTSAKSEFASFKIDDKILSMQFHPEYTQEYHVLLTKKNAHLFTDAVLDETMQNINKPTNHDLILNQIMEFLLI